MKALPLVKILFVLPVFISSACFAQVYEKGYVVNNANDTLRGLILMSKEMNSVSFSHDKEVVYSAKDVKAVKLESGPYYISHDSVDNARVFLETLLAGKVSLYKFMDRLFVKSTSENKLYELTQKTTTRLVNGVEMYATSKPYLGILTFMLMDCPKTNQARIKRVLLNEIDVTKLLLEYYSCTNQGVVDYKKGKRNIAIDWGITLNPGFSKFKLYESKAPIYLTGKETWDFKPFISGGLVFEVYSERTGGKFKYRQEILFVQKNQSGKRENYSKEYYEQSVYIDIKSSLLQANFLLSYNYLTKQNYSSFFYIGPSVNYVLNYEDTRLIRFKNLAAGPYSTVTTDNFLEPKYKLFYGASAGVGFEKSLNDNYKIQLDGRLGIFLCDYQDTDFEIDDMFHTDLTFQLGITLLKK